MKKIMLVMTMLILLVQVVLAEKIAILDFVEKDRGAQYISSALMKRDFKNLFKEYDNLELINNKVTAKAMKAKGFSDANSMGKADREAVGKELEADILMWGNVSSISGSDFKMTVFLMSMKSLDVQLLNFNVKRSTDQRIEAMKQDLIPKLLEAGSGDIKKIRGIAVQNFNTGNYEQALEGFKEVLDIDPNDVDAYGYIGYIYFSQGNYEATIDYYQQAIALDPTNRLMLESLASAYLKNDQKEEAIQTYEAIVAMDNDKDILLKIAHIYAEEEEIDSAQEAYERAIELDPEFSVAYLELGSMLYDMDTFEEAIPFLEKASKYYPDDDVLQKKLAKCYLKTNQLDAAIEQYKSVVAENPDNTKAYFNLAGAYRMKEMNKEALKTLEDLKKIDPDNIRILLAKADVYVAMNKLTEAEKQANAALAKDATLYEPYRLLATIKLKQGQKKFEKYNWYVEEYKDKNKYYGQKADQLVEARDKVREEAYRLFTKSKEYLKQAGKVTDNPSNIRDINKSIELLSQYLKATKEDNF